MREPAIRKARPEDCPVLTELEFVSRHAAFVEMYGNGLGEPDRQELASRWEQKLSSKKFLILMAYYDGEPAGYINLARGTDPLFFWIAGLYVLPSHWGDGTAQALMEEADGVFSRIAAAENRRRLEAGLEMSHPVTELQIVRENVRAERFYRKHGFAPTGKTEFCDLGVKRIVICNMRKNWNTYGI